MSDKKSEMKMEKKKSKKFTFIDLFAGRDLSKQY